jgi:DNA-directed RNA polymerase specialized sigma24 family protein
MNNFDSSAEWENRADELLESFDSSILRRVRGSFRKYGIPASEVEDAIQEVRLRLFIAASARPIREPERYIFRIVHSVLIDMQRRIKPPSSSLEEDGELASSIPLTCPSQETLDPAEILVKSEELNATIDLIANLPPRQHYAILCNIKTVLEEYPDDFQPFRALLRKHGLDIEFVRWPEDQNELVRLRASCSVAHKKLREFRQQRDADR